MSDGRCPYCLGYMTSGGCVTLGCTGRFMPTPVGIHPIPDPKDAELTALRARCALMEKERDEYRRSYEAAKRLDENATEALRLAKAYALAAEARVAVLEWERDELRVALEFYADDRKYEAPEGARPAIVAFDSGAHARTVLLRTGKARASLAPVKGGA